MISSPDNDRFEIPERMPLVPVRDLVVFPYTIVPLFISRAASVSAIDAAVSSNRIALLSAQREVDRDDPSLEDMHRVGTVGMVMRTRRLDDGRMKALVQGLVRGRLEEIEEQKPHFTARVSPIYSLPLDEISLTTEALMRTLREKLQRYDELTQVPGPDVMVVLQGLKDPGRLADLIASNLPLPVETAQQVLQTPDPVKRLRLVADLLERELQLSQTKARIETRTREKMGRKQREYFLREQLGQIRAELGEDVEDAELGELGQRIADSDMPEGALDEARKQLARLKSMRPESAEAGTIRSYLDWLLDLTWRTATEDNLDLQRAAKILDEDHFGLNEAKDRVLEFLGVKKLNPDNPGAILLLVGPPGVGKTSLGRSIAKATGRKFVRVSLGGIKDGAEIHGHRRTYVGALPGRIIQGMKQAGSINPVFMLDEIDKLGNDFRGDPAAALLQVLDPAQNAEFVDHYLNLPFDLSRVMFIATANRSDTIPGPLLDRTEEIRLSGYDIDDKIAIAKLYLIPRQLAAVGLSKAVVELPDSTLRRMVERHTREAGLRQLERAIGQVLRKIARRVAEGSEPPARIEEDDLVGYLGSPVHLPLERLPVDTIGVANGLAWTPAGGELIQVEVAAMSGKGQLVLTGQLGDVMKESAQAALSFTRSLASRMGVADDYFATHDLHVHVPAGAIPKDGPSAGVTMVVALVSRVTKIPVRRTVAMTGEISLSGRLLPIGGMREKILAGIGAGIKKVLLPEQNRGDLDELPEGLTGRLEVRTVSTVEEALEQALVKRPFRS